MTSQTETAYRDQKAAAAFLHLSERTLEAWRHRGGGPTYFKAGRRVLYRVTDLDAFIEAGRRACTRDAA